MGTFVSSSASSRASSRASFRASSRASFRASSHASSRAFLYSSRFFLSDERSRRRNDICDASIEFKLNVFFIISKSKRFRWLNRSKSCFCRFIDFRERSLSRITDDSLIRRRSFSERSRSSSERDSEKDSEKDAKADAKANVISFIELCTKDFSNRQCVCMSFNWMNSSVSWSYIRCWILCEHESSMTMINTLMHADRAVRVDVIRRYCW